MRKLLYVGAWILLLAPDPLAAQSPQQLSTARASRVPGFETIHGFVVPLNFVDNGASVPQKSILGYEVGNQYRWSLTERYPKVFRLHDYLYSDPGIEAYPDLTRAQVDAVMWVQLVTQGCDSKEATLIHTAVRMEGMTHTARGETPKKQPSLSDLLQPASAKEIGNDDSGESMNPSQPEFTPRVVFDDGATKPSTTQNQSMNPSQPAPTKRIINNPTGVSRNPSPPVQKPRIKFDASGVNMNPSPPAPKKQIPNDASGVNMNPSPPTVTKRFGYDESLPKPAPTKGVNMNPSQSAPTKRVVFDDTATKQLAPKGVTMRVGINQGTLQRAETPPTLLDAIRAAK